MCSCSTCSRSASHPVYPPQLTPHFLPAFHLPCSGSPVGWGLPCPVPQPPLRCCVSACRCFGRGEERKPSRPGGSMLGARHAPSGARRGWEVSAAQVLLRLGAWAMAHPCTHSSVSLLHCLHPGCVPPGKGSPFVLQLCLLDKEKPTESSAAPRGSGLGVLHGPS